MNQPLRLVFFGSDSLALPVLESLSDSGSAPANVVAIFTQPDRPHGRGQKLQPGAIKLWAIERGIPVYQPERLGPEDGARIREEFCADVSLVMAYGLILKDDLLGAPRLGTYNVHTSILPRFRGASPVATAIASGLSETGVTFMKLVRRLDAGPTGGVERVPIGTGDTSDSVSAKLGEAAVRLVSTSLRDLASGDLVLMEQDEERATYCRRLSKGDGVLDFGKPAAELAARINGLAPWPGSVVEVAGTTLKIGLAAETDAGSTEAPGTVLGIQQGAVLVATGSKTLRLLRLQRPGGRMLDAREFLRGFPIPEGTRLPSHPMPHLESTHPFPRA